MHKIIVELNFYLSFVENSNCEVLFQTLDVKLFNKYY